MLEKDYFRIIQRKFAIITVAINDLWKLASKRKGYFTLIIALTVLAALSEGFGLTLIIPLLDSLQGSNTSNTTMEQIPLVNKFIHYFQVGDIGDRISNIAYFLIGIILVRSILMFFVKYISGILPLKIFGELANQLYETVQGLELGKLNDARYGDIKALFNFYTYRVGTILYNITEIISNLILFTLYVMLTLIISWKLTLLVVCFLGTIGALLKLFTIGPLSRMSKAATRAFANLEAFFQEAYFAIPMIRIHNAQAQMQEKCESFLSDAVKQQKKSVFFNSLYPPIFMALIGILISLLLLIGLALNGTENINWIGEIFFMIIVLFRMMSPVQMIISSTSTIIGDYDAYRKYRNFISNSAQHQEISGRKIIRKFKHSIEFRNVAFSYENSDVSVLNDISFNIKEGSMVAIVGSSGAGKTTIASLIAKFYRPTSGQILIDNENINELDLNSWRQRIGLVTQNISLFNDTVYNNLIFGLEKINDQTVQEAIIRSESKEFIDAMPLGLNTIIGDQGVKLSGGQRQRLSIARTLLKNPDLIILDEATSQLDSITETAIQKTITRLHGECTILVIAHRLATVQAADNIFVVENGEVKQSGTHQELMSKEGAYKRLAETQSLELIGN